MAKSDLNYELDATIRKRICCVRDYIHTAIQVEAIYLYGSIAKGCYTKRSDIDLLVLLNGEYDIRKLRELRHLLEDGIDTLALGMEVDLKVYTTSRYAELCKVPCFEQAIQKDLIDIEKW
ncbi:MAG: nucleotidyltransferase domain-containing protein [Cellulosilyticaceae bacterium]